ncbi:GDSL esterase/lipase [Quillaja saponaria]|uniref:GDSL esterase/lipase n=1 Tax=Quillaja saponaria TaxID=32244 RepID=A0AAD7PRL0_QUISA|nr:GDSL esterase/lipase [Quillaja saponaria]
MSSETETFSISGPSHLTAIDWKNTYHRRCVVASLVQGVYILERDRQQNRIGSQKALAPLWWNFFHFQLNNMLVDSADHSIFGAIFELKPCLNAPRFVIAFRGTLIESGTRSRDIHLDLKCIVNRLHKSSRFQLAIHSIQETIGLAGASNVWLAGHSLGSAIALLAGKNMTKMGYPLETYLFNSPFVSAPLERIKDQKVKHGIHIASSVVKAGLTVALKCQHKQSKPQQDDPFVVLSYWIPHLFVNPADHISSGYIDYFAHREKMEKIGAGKIEKLATKHTVESLLSGAILDRISEPLHLLPSAELTINKSDSTNFRKAHGIEQWWDPTIHCPSLVYQYRY